MQILYVEDYDGASIVGMDDAIVYADEPEVGFDNAHYAALEVAEGICDAMKSADCKVRYYKVFLSRADHKGKALMFDDMLKIAQDKIKSFNGSMMCDGCIAGKAEFVVPGMIRLCLKCFEKDLK